MWTISSTTAEAYKSLGVRAPVASDSGATTAGSAATSQPANEFPILGVLSFVAALAAGGALALVLSQTEIDPNLAQLGMFGGAGIAVALGLLSLFKESSWGRGLGAIALLAGIAVAAMGYMKQRDAAAVPPAQGGEEESDAEDEQGAAATPEGQPDEATLQPNASDPAPADGSDESSTSQTQETSEDGGEETLPEETTPSQDGSTSDETPATDEAEGEEPDSE